MKMKLQEREHDDIVAAPATHGRSRVTVGKHQAQVHPLGSFARPRTRGPASMKASAGKRNDSVASLLISHRTASLPLPLKENGMLPRLTRIKGLALP